MDKYLELNDEKSSKFWQIQTHDISFSTTYGKIGTDGKSTTKTFDSKEKCLKEAEKLVNQKLKKGYVDTSQEEEKDAIAPKIIKKAVQKEGIEDGEIVHVQGSAIKPYELKNMGGVYSCSCPAWRNQSKAIEQRTCKHLRSYLGDKFEEDRVGSLQPVRKSKKASDDKESPPLLLAHSYESSIDISGWWMSEKLDGVRAYWDGQKFLSRTGKEYFSPDWFTEDLPNIPLDGELWLDRGQFQKTVSIVRRQDRSDHWKNITFMIFDAPALPDVFEDRLSHLKKLFSKSDSKYAKILEHQICKDQKHLDSEMEQMEKLGGEGIMLRQPASKYVAGRSVTLLKVKNFIDSEAIVVDIQAGKGRHKGRMGALVVELPNSKQFKIGTGFSDSDRESPPPINSIVTFRYQELTNGGIPRFPSFVGIRHDVDFKYTSPKTSPAKSVKKAVSDTSDSASLADFNGQYFEYKDEKSHKFWKIESSQNDVITEFGKVGNRGQKKVKTLDSPEDAKSHLTKQIAAKLKKGYQEKKVEDTSPKTSPAKPVKKTVSDTSGSASLADFKGQYFEYKDEKSHKFWKIESNQNNVITEFGKVGNHGQRRVKTLDSPEDAKSHLTKQIAAKLKKGYQKKKDL